MGGRPYSSRPFSLDLAAVDDSGVPTPLEELGRLIESVRKSAGFDGDLKGFAATIDIHYTHLSKLEGGDAAPSKQLLRRLADKHGADYGQMFRLLAKAKDWDHAEAAATTAAPTKRELAAQRKGKLPVVGIAKCGPFIEAVQITDDLPGIQDWEEADPKLTKGKRAFWVRVDGDSMNREGILPGDLLLVTQEPHEPGKPALVRLENEITVKFVEDEGDYIALIPSSTNPANTRRRISKKEWRAKGGATCRVVGFKAFRRL